MAEILLKLMREGVCAARQDPFRVHPPWAGAMPCDHAIIKQRASPRWAGLKWLERRCQASVPGAREDQKL
jgi:hypothetical protein